MLTVREGGREGDLYISHDLDTYSVGRERGRLWVFWLERIERV